MADRKFCDGCGEDMTTDAAVSGSVVVTQQRPFEARANPTYPPLVPIRVTLRAEIGSNRGMLMDGDHAAPGDVCLACLRKAVAEGNAQPPREASR